MTEKVPLNGLKTTGPLVAVWVCAGKGGSDMVPRFCQALSSLKVNIAFMTATPMGGMEPSLCCIESGDHTRVAKLIASDLELSTCVRFASKEVGLLSMFPHQASMKVLGMTLNILSGRGIPVHGLASSIAALTFVIDFDRLEQATVDLLEVIKLPSNAAPVQNGIRVRQQGV